MDALRRTLQYRAGGRKISLRPDPELLAVDLSQLEASQLTALESDAPAPLPKIDAILSLISRKQLNKVQIADLVGKKAISPVFSADGARIVAQPEVRVEPTENDSGELADMKQLDQWLGENEDKVRVVAKKDDRYVLAPLSGFGPDAVTLANDIATSFGSLSASPRFIRIVPGAAVSAKSGISRPAKG